MAAYRTLGGPENSAGSLVGGVRVKRLGPRTGADPLVGRLCPATAD